MKYYSEILRRTYDSENDCVAAEKEYEEKVAAEKAKKEALAAERKERAKEVEDAYKAFMDAQKHYHKLRNEFVNDYGSWHMTISSQNDIDECINSFFRFF